MTLAKEKPKSLPDGWATAPVGDIVGLINGRAFKPTDWKQEGLPIVRIQNLNDSSAPFNYYPGNLPEKFLIGDGDLLFAWSGTPGTSFGAHIWQGGKAWLNQHIFKVVFDDRSLNKSFLRYAINQNLNNYISAAHGGAGLAHITKGRFEASELLLPPLPEQHRIVAEIEKQFTRLEAGIAALRRAQANLKRYRAAVLKAACKGRLVPTEAELARKERRPYEPAEKLLERILVERRTKWTGKGKYKEPITPDTTGLPELTEGWCWATADQCAARITDGEHITPERSDSGIYFVSARNVLDGRLSLDDVDHVPPHVFEQITKRLVVEPGDVLLSCSGTVGRSCVVPADLVIALVRSVAILKPVMKTGKFLSFALRSPVLQLQIDRKKTQTAQANIFQGKIKTLVFPLPPLPEQERIVAEVERRVSVVDELAMMIAANLKRAERLRQAIFKRAFEGKLVPQDPKDEPASVLLVRIKAERSSTGRKVSKTKGLKRQSAT